MTKDEMVAYKIPEELHENPTLKEAKDIASMAKAYVDTKAFVGSSIRIPGQDAGEEDKKAFREKLKTAAPELIEVPADPAKFAEVEGQLFEKLGRPKKVEEYPGLKESKIEVPAEVKIEETELRTLAHRLGMTKKQYLEMAKSVVEQRTKEAGLASEARTTLKKELGDAFDERLAAAALAAKKHGMSEAFVTNLRTGNIPPEQARGWIAVAKATGTEGSDFGRGAGGTEGGKGKLTPGEAEAQLAELRKNPALWERNHPEQKRLTQKLVELTAIAYPS